MHRYFNDILKQVDENYVESKTCVKRKSYIEKESEEIELVENFDLDFQEDQAEQVQELFDGYLGEQKEVPNPLDYGPNATYRNLREGVVYKKGLDNLWETFVKDGQPGKQGNPGSGVGVNEVKQIITNETGITKNENNDIVLAGTYIPKAERKSDIIQHLGYDYTNDYPIITTAVDGSSFPRSAPSIEPYMSLMDKTPAWSANQNKVPSSLELTPQRYCFSTDANFQAVFYGDGDKLRMWVDGKNVSATNILSASQTVRLNMTWPIQKRRTITIQAQQFLGCRTVESDVVSPGYNSCVGSLVVIGDSWVVGGLNYSKMSELWPHQLSTRLGVQNYFAAGDSGTGYANAQNGPIFGDQSRWDSSVSYVPNDSWVVVFGSINDAGYSVSAVENGAKLLFDKIYGKFYNRKVLIVGPPRISSQNLTLLSANENVIFDVAKSYGFSTLSTSGWFSGTGTTSNIVGDGNQDYFIGADGFHMTPRGHNYVGNLIYQKIISMCI